MVKWGMQLYDWVENIVGKGEIARYEQFLVFPQYFQSLSVVDASKWVYVEERVILSMTDSLYIKEKEK